MRARARTGLYLGCELVLVLAVLTARREERAWRSCWGGGGLLSGAYRRILEGPETFYMGMEYILCSWDMGQREL